MSGFMQQIVADAAQQGPQWLREVQAPARTSVQGISLPTRKVESWKYTSLGALREDYRPAIRGVTAPAELPPRLREGFGGPRLVFVDGVFETTLSTLDLPAGIRVCRFADADEAGARRIAEHLDATIDARAHPFAALNSAVLDDGVLLEVDADAELEVPVECLWLTRGADHPVRVNQRLLVLAGANSKAAVIEHFAALGGAQASFCNGVTELVLESGAKLSHYRLHEESGEAIHIGGVHARLGRDAHLDAFHLALGSELKRLDIVINHAGAGAHVDLNGVYLPRGEEHIDYHTTIEHAVPHCTSDEVFRGIIADRASAVFNGRIHIHPQAQKTRAELSNKNLLTSSEAEINTKPELEIYADDVQCAHGATVAQLDEGGLHYLRTRGVSREEAEVMLSFGFINELIEGIGNDAVRDYLRTLLATRFARDTELARHLL